MAYGVDNNYQNVNKDVDQYLREQQKLKGDIGKGTLFGGQGIDVGVAAAEFRLAAAQQDRYDAFNRMADDYFDGKRIEEIQESRRRDTLTDAIDERNNRVQAAMQQGSYVDQRDRDFLAHTNIKQFDEARMQQELHEKDVRNDVKISEINQQKDLQLEQAELDVISQLTGKNEYGQPIQQTAEDIKALRERMSLIQELRTGASLDSRVQKPNVMSTEELMANQIKLQELQQQLGTEYDALGDSLTHSGRSK